MKKLLYALFATACILSCTTDKPTFTIQGSLPSNKYDGKLIYLVPLKNADSTNVDSFRIKDKKFEFKGNVERMCILRMAPIYRLEMQELLIVTEKGLTTVLIDSNSIAKGTPQNIALQQWKDKQMQLLKFNNKVHKALQAKCDRLDSVVWKIRTDSASQSMKDFGIKLLKQQKNNTIGQFLYEMYSPFLNTKEKAALTSIFEKKK
jgi:hypothetical protein